jgi:hypothetical protein
MSFTGSFFLILLLFLLIALSQGHSQENRLALNFDNTTQSNAQRVHLGSGGILKPFYLTAEAWVKPAQWHRRGGDNTIISCTQNGGYAIYVQAATGKLLFVAYANGSFQTASLVVAGNLIDGQWCHLAGTWDGLAARLYVNGKLRATSYPLRANRGITYGSFNDQLFLGAESAGNSSTPEPNRYYTGKIDEVRIWNYARSESELSGQYASELDLATVPVPGLMAYYRANDGMGRTYLTNYTADPTEGVLAGASFTTGVILTPHKQASRVVVSNITPNSAIISHMRGSGLSYYGFVKEASTGTADPVDGTSYEENADFSRATVTAGGWKLMFIRSDGAQVITGLKPGTTYRIHIVSANQSDNPQDYLPGTPQRYNRTAALNNPINFTTAGSSSNSLLPLTWLHFSATSKESTVLVKWKTGQEVNNKQFTILHSTDATSWRTIGEVRSVAMPQLINDYQFTHLQPAAGKNYYQIKQTDLDGRTSVTQLLVVDVRRKEPLVQLYPNPVTQGKVAFKLREAGVVSLYDNKGSLRWSGSCTAGAQAIQVSDYAKGLYYLKTGGESIPFVIIQ